MRANSSSRGRLCYFLQAYSPNWHHSLSQDSDSSVRYHSFPSDFHRLCIGLLLPHQHPTWCSLRKRGETRKPFVSIISSLLLLSERFPKSSFEVRVEYNCNSLHKGRWTNRTSIVVFKKIFILCYVCQCFACTHVSIPCACHDYKVQKK